MSSWIHTNLNELKTFSTRPITVFVDDGDVLNDNTVRGREWLRLIGEFMPPRLGGTAEQWASANRVVFPRVWGNLLKQMPDFASHQEFQRTYAVSWMTEMCAGVGVAPLPNDAAATLYTELSIHVGERATSAIAGAADAVRTLHSAGYRLYTASGTTSWELSPIMTRMGIAELFSGFYGPDLIDHVKYGPAYYQQVFNDAGVRPDRALVIDSDAECCQWASEAGANAIWIDPDGRGDAPTLEEFVHTLV